MNINTAIPDVANPFYEQSVDLSQDDVFTLAGFTMCGPGLGKAVRERFVAVAANLLRKHGPRAFEMPKRAAAIHEAGHIVINSVLGVRTTNVLIDPITRNGKLFWIGNTKPLNWLSWIRWRLRWVSMTSWHGRASHTPASPQKCFLLATTDAKVRRSTK